MSKRITATSANLNSQIEYCPNCNRLYTPVEYYTGHVVSQNRYSVNANTTCTETVYRNVTQHTGGLCRWCAKTNQKRTAKIWGIIGGIGLLVCVAGVLIPFLLPPESRQKLLNISMMLGMLGGLAFIIGGCVLLAYAANRPSSNINYINAYNMFLSNLRKDGLSSPSLGYLSKYEAKRLRVK